MVISRMVDFPDYRPRLADKHLGDLFAEFPGVMINGARATGTSASKMMAPPPACAAAQGHLLRSTPLLIRLRNAISRLGGGHRADP